MIWQPLNLTEVCPASTSITACSSFAYVYLNLIVQLYGGSRDERKQKRKKPDVQRKLYDFIVVGAGSAGCIVANRLSENPNYNVLLLEAGPEQPDVSYPPGFSSIMIGSNIDWGYTTEPNGKSCLVRPGGRCPWPRGKTMGGSSTINSMSYIRGNKVDFDGWAAQGNTGWSFKEVLPFFKKSEKNLNISMFSDIDRKYHGTEGEQLVSSYPYVDKPSRMITEAMVERGLPLVDYNGESQEGAMQAQACVFKGERISTNTAFITPIRNKRKNLTVKTNSEVKKILINGKKRAYGVIYLEKGKDVYVGAKKDVILCAGAINSPQLLMVSGIGPKGHLEKLGIPVIQDLYVGKNLQDHVTFNGVIIGLSNKTSTTASEDEILDSVRDYTVNKDERGLASNGPTNSIGFLKTEPNLIAPDIQYQVGHIPNWKELVDDPITGESITIFPTIFYDALLFRAMNVVPKSRGELLLNESNPYGPPLIYPNYFDDESDMIPLLKGVDFIRSLEDTKAFKSNGAFLIRESLVPCQDYTWGTVEYYICLAKSYTGTTYHPVGTCKMGPKCDKEAVVDNELRVYGVCGLRVIDASIMPTIVRGNTNAATMMTGEKGVDYIIKYWSKHSDCDCYYP